MLHCDIELHRFTLSMNLQRYLVAGKGARGQEISKVELLIKRINVVTILIDIEVANGGLNITPFLAGSFPPAPPAGAPHTQPPPPFPFSSALCLVRVPA